MVVNQNDLEIIINRTEGTHLIANLNPHKLTLLKLNNRLNALPIDTRDIDRLRTDRFQICLVATCMPIKVKSSLVHQ